MYLIPGILFKELKSTFNHQIMESIEQLNSAFVKGFLKDWKNLTKEESEAIFNRKFVLNKDFQFTEEVIRRLRFINDMLRKEELRILEKTQKIWAIQEALLKELVIDDYEVDTEINCWGGTYYISLHEDFEGNPFYKNHTLHVFWKEKSELHFTENWNDFENQPNHPLAREYHCYLFHHLYDHTQLAWEDILRIDEIWVEITIRNQFFSTLLDK